MNRCFALGLLLGLAVPSMAVTGQVPDANHNGRADVDDILGCIDYCERAGVVFDDKDPLGHIPVRRPDRNYHMVCVDLVAVSYRTAGYAFGGDLDPINRPGAPFVNAGLYRQVVQMRARVQSDPRFRYFPGPGINPIPGGWRPPSAFRIGDMVFVHYNDAADYHIGIVTGVDPRTGLPSYVTEVSPYTPSGGLYRSTWREFFGLRCRVLTGWARPATWDGAPVSALERALTVIPPPQPARSVRLFGSTASRLSAALEKVRASHRGYEPSAPSSISAAPAPVQAGNWRRHSGHYLQ